MLESVELTQETSPCPHHHHLHIPCKEGRKPHTQLILCVRTDYEPCISPNIHIVPSILSFKTSSTYVKIYAKNLADELVH